MAWIDIIAEDEVTEGSLHEAYRGINRGKGRVANILRVHSVNPKAMAGHYALYRTIMFGRSELSRAEREAMAVAVSVANRCEY